MHEGRWYGSIAAPLGLAITASAVLLLIAMLVLLIGPFRIAPVIVQPEDRALRVGLWVPPSAERLLEASRGRRSREWRALLPPPYDLVESARLAELRSLGVDAVVIVDARALSESELAELEAYTRSGGAAVLAGWVGVLGADGQRLGTERMCSLLDVKRVELLDREASYFAAAGPRGPLVASLAPGQRLSLAAMPEVPAIAAPESELFWASWDLRPIVPVSGASRRRSLGDGRLVWLAMSPESTGASAATRVELRRIVANALSWARREPVGELLLWPERAPFAALLAMDTEDGFENATAVAAQAERRGVPLTFLVLTELAWRFPQVVSRMAAAGEIGSHADVHTGLKDLPDREQRARIERSVRELASLGVHKLDGFRPPYESYDDATLRSLVDADFTYLLGDRELPSLAPRIINPDGGGRSLVQIPRTVADDVELLVKRGLGDAELERSLLEDLTRIERSGGLYYFSFHTQHLGNAARLGQLDRLVDELEARGAWLATGRDLAGWWRRRASVAVSLKAAGPTRLWVKVANHGAEAAEGLALRLHLDARRGTVRASSARLFQPSPRVQAEGSPSVVDLLLPTIDPGADHSYTIDFVPSSR